MQTRKGDPTIVLVITHPIDAADLGRLCERVRAVMADPGTDVVICDVGGLAAPDAATVDTLARLQLTAKRLGGSVRLVSAGEQLKDLLALMGLRDVIPVVAELRVEARRETEQREQRGGVEEEGDAGDLSI